MKHAAIRTLSAAIGAVFMTAPAFAHVGYNGALFIQQGGVDPIGSLATAGSIFSNDTVGAASNFNSTASSNAGYITGLDPVTAGNTHDIRFRYFVLTKESNVSFSINGLANSVVSGNANPALNGLTASRLNPGFSLYRGILPPSSHDGVGSAPAVAADPDIAALLQSQPGFAPWSPFAGTNAAIDAAKGLPAGTTAATGTQWGVFHTNGDVTTGNDGVSPGGATFSYLYGNGDNTPTTGTIQYTGISGADAAAGATFIDSQGVVRPVLGADGTLDNRVSFSGVLSAGIYTLAIGGAGIDDYDSLFADIRASMAGSSLDTAANNAYAADRLARKLSITDFSVTAVPEPSTVGLMVAGLVSAGAMRLRKARGTI